VCRAYYWNDPMISKMIVWGENREIATRRSISALQNYVIHGIRTNIEYLLGVIQNSAFQENKLSTKFCDEHTADILNKISQEKSELTVPVIAFTLFSLRFTSNKNTQNIWQYIGYWRNKIQLEVSVQEDLFSLILEKNKEDEMEIQFENTIFSVKNIEAGNNEINFNIDGINHRAYISFDEKGLSWISFNGKLFQKKRLDMLNMKEDFTSNLQGDGISNLFSPMPGKVIKVNVKAGDKVKRGKVLLVVEAMKMENNIVAEDAAIVEKVVAIEGDMVDADTQLVFLKGIEKE